MPLYIKKKKLASFVSVLKQRAELKLNLFKWKTDARELLRMVWIKVSLISF